MSEYDSRSVLRSLQVRSLGWVTEGLRVEDLGFRSEYVAEPLQCRDLVKSHGHADAGREEQDLLVSSVARSKKRL
jgi:hypothetical protein